MPPLAGQLQAQVTIDLGAIFTTLASAMTGADLGEIRFDADGIVALVTELAPPELGDVLAAVTAVAGSLDGALPAGVGHIPALADIEALAGKIGGLGAGTFAVDVSADVGLDALTARMDAVQGALGGGALAELLGLIPGVSLGDLVPRVGGPIGGLIALLQVLGGLSATSAISARLAVRAEALAGLLDVEAATAAATDLTARSADIALVGRIRNANPDDPDSTAAIGVAVADFQRAVLTVADSWAVGMGFGEAALGRLDLTASALGLEAARLALESADLAAVGELATTVRGLLSPVIDTPLPAAGAIAGSAIDVGVTMVGRLTGAVDAWDAAGIADPVRSVLSVALDPLSAAAHAVEAVGVQVAAAIRTVASLLTELDLTPVAAAVRRTTQPVLDAITAIESAIGTAETTLRGVCQGMEDGLTPVATAVGTAAATVHTGLDPLHTTLSTLDLAGLAERLRTELGTVANALASAQLSPYFDAAIDVIDTTADVIDAVPFAMLPTDVQQEIVDVCAPIKQLDLQPVEDELRAGLADITASMQVDALDAFEQAYADVVAVLAGLDPGPRLVELEVGPLAELRALVESIDPTALLAPVDGALGDFRAVLDGVDLHATVIAPLQDALAPIGDALAAIDPVALLAGVGAAIGEARAVITELLHLDDAEDALASFRTLVADLLDRVDATGLAAVLDQAVAARLGRAEPGPPGGALATVITAVAQATGLDADAAGVAEALHWVGGVDGAPVVRARLDTTAVSLRDTAVSVRALDPGPLVAAAQAQRRALLDALAQHPADSGLRGVVDPLLAGRPPAEVLGPLVENRQRYLVRLDAETAVASTLAASGRSEITASATGLRAALTPLDAVPARVRAVLGALGLATADGPFTDILDHLLATAGPARLIPALTGLIDSAKGKVLQAVDALLAPATETVETVRALLAAFDIAAVQAELVTLHQQVGAQVAAASPRALLGDVIDTADATVAALAAFDPLGPVRDVVDAAKAVALGVLETARPTVAFADVVTLHADLVRLAAGLDVRSLLEPILSALASLSGQLDTGFDQTGDSLQRLQAALPGEVVDTAVSGGIEVSIG